MVVILTTYKSPRAPVIWTARYPILQVPALSDYSYWQAFNLLWDQDVIIVNIEHDIFPTKSQIDTLLKCQHEFCAWCYNCPDDSLIENGKLVDKQATGLQLQAWEGGRPVEYGSEHADVAGIGFCKLGVKRGLELSPVPWYLVDSQVNLAVKAKGGWHLHWPLIGHRPIGPKFTAPDGNMEWAELPK